MKPNIFFNLVIGKRIEAAEIATDESGNVVIKSLTLEGGNYIFFTASGQVDEDRVWVEH